MSQSRQLAAIMFTDIVGYTALMGADEQKAFELLKKNRSVQRPLIEKFNGRWLKEIGDGVLASFNAVSDAVYCAGTIQQACENEPDLKLRIGIHLGEVVFEENDVFGDGVNIASRLESLAPIGGILVSESVHNNLLNKKGVESQFVSQEQLKNVKEPVKVYEVRIEGVEAIKQPAYATESTIATNTTLQKSNNTKKVALGALGFVIILLLSYLFYTSQHNSEATTELLIEESKKSIAVLPFHDISLSGDQRWFSDGTTSAIRKHLTLIEALKVKSKISVEQYRGSSKTIPQIAQELGVTYVLEGDIQLYNDSVRIVVQLIDTKSDTHLWADNYDHSFQGIFSIQSDIAIKVAEVLKAEISSEIISEIERKPTYSPEAYALYLRGWETRDIAYLDQAIALDSGYADAYASKGFFWLMDGANGQEPSAQIALSHALPLVNKALDIDADHALAHAALGAMQLWYLWNFKEAENEYLAAIRADPSEDFTIYPYCELLLATGRFQEALNRWKQAFEQDDVTEGPPGRFLFHAGQVEEAMRWVESEVESNSLSFRESTPLLIYLGRYESVIKQHRFGLRYFGYENKLENVAPLYLGLSAIAYFKIGQFDSTKIRLKIMKEKSNQSPVGSPSFFTAMVYAQMGETDTAFKWLEKAYKDHEVEMYWLKVEPPFEPLRSDPRWQEMLDKVGFPE